MDNHKNGKIVNFVQEGEGQPVVLIHGIAASLYDWANIIPDLVAGGYQACALDLLGHGESIKPDNPLVYNVESLFEHFTTWLDELHVNHPLFLVGHSLGGYLSILYALRYPSRVRSMVLIDPFYSLKQISPILRLVGRRPHVSERTMRVVPEWLINYVLGWDPSSAANFSPQARQQIANDYKRASPHFIRITRDIPDLTPVLHRVNIPTLVIWGERDLTLKPHSFKLMVEKLPVSSSCAIPECGHQPHIGKPATVNQLVLDFFTSLHAVDAKSTSR